MVTAVQNQTAIPAAQKKENSSIVGTVIKSSIAAGTGAGLGYLAYSRSLPSIGEAFAKDFVKMSEDGFVKQGIEQIETSVRGSVGDQGVPSNFQEIIESKSAQLKEQFKAGKVQAEEALAACKKIKTKYIAVGAVVGLGLYLGVKALFGHKKEEKAG